MTSSERHPADSKAINLMLAVTPIWQAQVKVKQAVGLDDNVLLHAGPQFDSVQNITKPILNSACVAAVFEGLASSLSSAEEAIMSQQIKLEPAQNYSIVTPLAAVVSASMWLHKVVDLHNPSNASYSPINGGNGAAMRLGLRSQDVVEHMRWLNGEFADCLASIQGLSVNLLSIASEALAQNDDCHGRTIVGTQGALTAIKDQIGNNPKAIQFIENGPSFFLNLWMAACKCTMNAAAGTENSSVITTIGSNGIDTGIQVAGLPGQWFCAAADAPKGDLGKFPVSRALGAIGDSAVVDACGFGAMSMNYSKPQQQGLGEYMPIDGLSRPAQILDAVNTQFGELNFRTGLTARTIVASDKPLLISLGILDVTGEAGRLGGGVFTTPMLPFNNAVKSLK